ncbi:MAG: tetratricopeptide (TPR) repeat protein [Flavobacteriaceae bacterium]|jgi:tetratricopeptide (TPR) repeat protein
MLEDITGEEIKRKFKTNKKLRYISFAVGAIVLLVLGYFLYRQFVWGPANDKSKDVYWQALNYAAVDSTDMAIDDLRSFSKKYNGKIGGEVSQFVYARQLMNQGEFKKAITELQDVDVDDSYVQVMAVGLQGDCHSELEKFEEAANTYLQAADMLENDFTTPMYLLKAGLCSEEIKNFEKAAELYERIKDDFPQYASQKQIEKYLARAKNKKTSK